MGNTNRPYIVSADIYLLLQKWASQKGFTLPPLDFFTELRKKMVVKLEEMFGLVDFVTEEDLQEGLSYFFQRNSLPVVSLDRIYVEAEFNLELTRAVDISGKDVGLKNRAGTPNLEYQLDLIKAGLAQTAAPAKIVLVDDVIFSGDMLMEVIEMLEKEGMEVAGVFAGIGVAEGVDKIKDKNIPVTCVYEYMEVIDEICERDFYPGVPLSGRLIANSSNIGSPYILPFGRPGKWASIPEEYQVEFSKFCWKQTSELFLAIEEYSGKKVFCYDLGRLIIDFPVNGTRYIKAIESVQVK